MDVYLYLLYPTTAGDLNLNHCKNVNQRNGYLYIKNIIIKARTTVNSSMKENR